MQGFKQGIAAAGEKMRSWAHLPGDGDIDGHEAQTESGCLGDQESEYPGDKTLDNRLRQQLHCYVAVGPAYGLEDADFSERRMRRPPQSWTR